MRTYRALLHIVVVSHVEVDPVRSTARPHLLRAEGDPVHD
jgi:hypothetical protein